MPWQYVPEVDAFTIYHQVQEEHKPSSSELDDGSFTSSLGHALAGATGTAISNVLVYPLDLVVTRLQTQAIKGSQAESSDKEKKYSGLADAFQKIYSQEGGLPAFYGGVVQDTAKSVADSFLFFLAYNALLSLRRSSSSDASNRNIFVRLADEVGIGMLAGAFTKGVTFPLQQVVTRKQMAGGASSAGNGSVTDILRGIYEKQGISGFWSGYSATLALTLNPSLAMSVHSFLERATLREGATPGALLTFLFAASSKAVASTVMYPVSLAKTRAQAESANGGDDKANEKARERPRRSILTPLTQSLMRIANEEGVGGLYAGLSGEVLKGFFSHGITMLVKQRIHVLVVSLYFWILRQLKQMRK